MAGIGQGGAQVIDMSEAVRAGYSVFQHNLALTEQVLNNAKATRQQDYTDLEALDAEAQLMDAQEVDRDVETARDWYADQIKAGRNVNTSKFRQEFRSKISGLAGKVNSIKGMRDEIQTNIDNLAKFKDPYADTEGRQIKLMQLRQERPDNWRFKSREIMSDSSGYKLGEKSKDVALSLGTNLKTVSWEKPIHGKKDDSGAQITETANTEYNPFFEDFNTETGEVTQKDQLDVDFVRTYLSDNPDHANALQTRRVDIQNDIIDLKIANNEELTQDEATWLNDMSNEQKLAKVFNDDMVQYGQAYRKPGAQETGVSTLGRGEYKSTSFSTAENKQALIERSIDTTAQQMLNRGPESLNELSLEGTVPNSFTTERGVDESTGRETITVKWKATSSKVASSTDPKTGEVTQIPIGKLKDVKDQEETFFVDDKHGLAMFLGGRQEYDNLGFDKSHVRPGVKPKGVTQAKSAVPKEGETTLERIKRERAEASK